MPKLVLASTSAYRKSLLDKLQLPFECAAPTRPEVRQDNEEAASMVLRLAKQKAQDVAPQFSDALIIGSDQAATIDQHILGKPGTYANAVNQLTQCSGKTVTFHTGLVVLNSRTSEQHHLVDEFSVKFKVLSDEQIHGYIEKEMPLDCAGSFKSEGLGICLFESLSGKDPNSLVGLPLIGLCQLLKRFDIDPLLNG